LKTISGYRINKNRFSAILQARQLVKGKLRGLCCSINLNTYWQILETNQIRNYVLHPYKQVKDVRTGFESKDPDKVLDGDLNAFIEAYLDKSLDK